MKANKLIVTLGLGVALLLPTSSLANSFDTHQRMNNHGYSKVSQKHVKKYHKKSHMVNNHYKRGDKHRNNDMAKVILAYALLASLH